MIVQSIVPRKAADVGCSNDECVHLYTAVLSTKNLVGSGWNSIYYTLVGSWVGSYLNLGKAAAASCYDLELFNQRGCPWVIAYTSPNGASHIELAWSPPG
jgi:hypothetical protein